MKQGSLIVVGTGFLVAGQVTPEALASMRAADRFFFLVAEPATRLWLESVLPAAESLHDVFWDGRPRMAAYEDIVERLLAAVRQGKDVCAAFYGHPGVFVHSSHEAVRRARAEGFTARMLPGVSAEDCLFADLEVDPAAYGCQSFEATDFLIRGRIFDPHSALILWQIGALGVTTYHLRELWNAGGLAILVEVLCRVYPPEHPVTVYEATHYPVCDPLIQRTTIAGIPGCCNSRVPGEYAFDSLGAAHRQGPARRRHGAAARPRRLKTGIATWDKERSRSSAPGTTWPARSPRRRCPA